MCKGWHSSIGDAPLTIINKYSNKLIIILSIKKIKNNSICVKGYLHYISLCYVHHHHHFGRFWGGRSKKPLAAKTDDPKKQAPFFFISHFSLSLSLSLSLSQSIFLFFTQISDTKLLLFNYPPLSSQSPQLSTHNTHLISLYPFSLLQSHDPQDRFHRSVSWDFVR